MNLRRSLPSGKSSTAAVSSQASLPSYPSSCELGRWRWTADHISQVFGARLTRRLNGRLRTTLEKIDQGHHALLFRAHCQNAFFKQ